MDEINHPRHLGFDIHFNYTPEGRKAYVDYLGQAASEHRTRITPEFSYALNRNFELGLYIPLATLGGSGQFDFGGVKARVKYVAPRPKGAHVLYGANFEIGHVDRQLNVNPWNAEAKGILGWRNAHWTLATNANVGFVVSGPEPSPVGFNLATHVTREVARNFAIGVESYNDFGSSRAFGRFGNTDQRLYAIVDTAIGRWDLQLGAGHGYGRPEDRWVVKAIIGVPLGRRLRAAEDAK